MWDNRFCQHNINDFLPQIKEKDEILETMVHKTINLTEKV
jgi:hypothetical protein